MLVPCSLPGPPVVSVFSPLWPGKGGWSHLTPEHTQWESDIRSWTRFITRADTKNIRRIRTIRVWTPTHQKAENQQGVVLVYRFQRASGFHSAPPGLISTSEQERGQEVVSLWEGWRTPAVSLGSPGPRRPHWTPPYFAFPALDQPCPGHRASGKGGGESGNQIIRANM